MKIEQLSKEELIKKLSILVDAIKAEPQWMFSFEAEWDENGMTIIIKPEGI